MFRYIAGIFATGQAQEVWVVESNLRVGSFATGQAVNLAVL